MSHIEYHLPGIHCDACERSVRGALERVDGVGAVTVNLDKKHVRVEYDPARTNVLALKEQLERAGFEVG